MFSPVGKKKLLLQMKMGGVDADDMASELAKTSPSKKGKGSSDESSPEKKDRTRVPLAGPTDSVASTTSLLASLASPGVPGIVMTRVLDATVRYRPDTDSHVLKAFHSKQIEHARFRGLLQSIFWLTFNDEEYTSLMEYFDPYDSKAVDGYQFIC